VTAGVPTISVDGENPGPATESADGKSLSLLTTDPSVLGASSVTTDLTVSVVDGAGRAWSAPVSTLNPAAVTRLPGTTSTWLRKVILQQVTIPTSVLSTKVEATDVREVWFSAGRGADSTDTGGVYLSDLSLEDRAVDGRVPAQQATVDMAPARVEEGPGPGTARVAAVLSRPAGH
jgi:trimeric autotransporter adhesin